MGLMDKFKALVKQENTAGENSPATDDCAQNMNEDSTVFKNSSKSLAEFACYYHKNGWSVERIASAVDWQVSEIRTMLRQAQEQDLYDSLANNYEN